MRARRSVDGRLIDDTGQDPVRADEVAPPTARRRELRQLVPRVLAALEERRRGGVMCTFCSQISFLPFFVAFLRMIHVRNCTKVKCCGYIKKEMLDLQKKKLAGMSSKSRVFFYALPKCMLLGRRE